MSESLGNLPEPEAFNQAIKLYLQHKVGNTFADLVLDSKCKFSLYSESQSYKEYIIYFFIPVPQFAKMADDDIETVRKAIYHLFPITAGNLDSVNILGLIENIKQEGIGLNVSSLNSLGAVEYDGLRFRSKSETKIYDSLKKSRVLFFPGAAAILGGKNLKREPDFLICQDGKWGVLEVMGADYHPNATADHERARLFKDYGVRVVEFYSAEMCYNTPEKVVNDFLQRL